MSPEEEKVINRNTMKLQDHLYKALKQRDQYKSERDKLKEYMKEETFYYQWQNCIDENEKLEREKKEREKRAEEANCQVASLQELLEINESSTKDLILKLQNSDTQKIEDENKELKRLAESRKGTIKGLKRHLKERNYQLAKINDRLYLDNYKLERENEEQLELLKDFSKFINYKLIVSPASDTYKHYRSELDKLGVK